METNKITNKQNEIMDEIRLTTGISSIPNENLINLLLKNELKRVKRINKK